MNKIDKQIVFLTKSIYLRPPIDREGYISEFRPGEKSDSLSGIGLSWWYTEQSFSTVENIALMLTNEIDEFSGCDHKTIENVIRDTLKILSVDDQIFCTDKIFFRSEGTLFERRKNISVNEFAHKIKERVITETHEHLIQCSILHIVPRLSGESFFIEQEKIYLINRNDTAYFDEFNKKKYWKKIFCREIYN